MPLDRHTVGPGVDRVDGSAIDALHHDVLDFDLVGPCRQFAATQSPDYQT